MVVSGRHPKILPPEAKDRMILWPVNTGCATLFIMNFLSNKNDFSKAESVVEYFLNEKRSQKISFMHSIIFNPNKRS